MTARARIAAGISAAVLASAPALLVVQPAAAITIPVTSDADSGPGSLRDAVIAANTTPGEDEITIDLTAAPDQTITLMAGPITITQGVTIRVIAGDATVTHAVSGDLFVIDQDATTDDDYEFEGLTMLGSGNGRAINAIDPEIGVLTVRDMRFDSMDAGALVHGSAIDANGVEALNVYSSTFDDCQASLSGGAIWLQNGGPLWVQDSTFTGNDSVDAFGGSIGVAGSGSVSIIASAFSDGSSEEGGGFIAVEESGDVTIDSVSTFENGIANDNSGGAVFVGASGHVYINDSQFRLNDAVGPGAYGGAIYVVSSTSFVLERSLVSQNTAALGGGVFVQNLDETSSILHSSIVNNTASLGGGGVYASALGVQFDVIGATFEDNTSANLGGGVFLNAVSDATSVLDSTFTANTVSGDNQAGVSIYVSGLTGSFDIVNSTFDETVGTSMVAVNDAGEGSGVVLSHSTLVGATGIQFFEEPDSVLVTHAAMETSGEPILGPDSPVPTEWSKFTQPLDVAEVDDLEGNTFGLASLMLGPLQGNGIVLPETREPLPGSPLIDSGNPEVSGAPDFDERGDGFTRIVRVIDVGAVEVQALTPAPSLPATGGSAPWWLLIASCVLVLVGIGALARPRITT